MAGIYDDIIGLERPVSGTRSPMPRAERAAQFSPFAALTGYEDILQEAARLTAEPVALGEDAREDLNRKLARLARAIPDRPAVELTWFEPDGLKLGGEYLTKTVTVRRVDETFGYLELEDRSLIPVGRILDLRGPLFLDGD